MSRPGPRLLLGINALWIPLAFLYDGLTVLVLPIRLSGDATAIGLVSFVGLLAAALAQPFAGWASDRLRATVDRRVFLAGAAIPLAMALLVFAGGTTALVVLVGYVLVQVAAGAVQAVHQSLLPEHVGPRARGSASGWKTAFDLGGSMLAFAVLGELLASGQSGTVAPVIVVLLVIAIGLVWRLVPATVASVPAGRSPRPIPAGPIPAGFVPLVLARFMFLFGTYAVGRFLVLLVAERMGIDPMSGADESGWLLALFALTTAAAAVGFGRMSDRRPRRQVMLLGVGLGTVGIIVLIPALGVAGVLAGGMIMGLGTAAFMSANWAAVADLAPPAEAGRVMALANLGTAFAAAAVGLLGLVLTYAGFAPVLILAASASAAAALPLVAVHTRPAPTLEEAT